MISPACYARRRIAFRAASRSGCSNASANWSSSLCVIPNALPASRHLEIERSIRPRISFALTGETWN